MIDTLYMLFHLIVITRLGLKHCDDHFLNEEIRGGGCNFSKDTKLVNNSIEIYIHICLVPIFTLLFDTGWYNIYTFIEDFLLM